MEVHGYSAASSCKIAASPIHSSFNVKPQPNQNKSEVLSHLSIYIFQPRISDSSVEGVIGKINALSDILAQGTDTVAAFGKPRCCFSHATQDVWSRQIRLYLCDCDFQTPTSVQDWVFTSVQHLSTQTAWHGEGVDYALAYKL